MSDPRRTIIEPRERRQDSPGAPAPGERHEQPGEDARDAPTGGGSPAASAAHSPDAGRRSPCGGEPSREGSAQVEGDLDELVRVSTQRDEYLALAQRTQADFENYRKRVARDSAVAQERGVAKLANELLPAIDNLDRALAAA